MMLINVFIQELDRDYDFSVDGCSTVGSFVADIVDTVSQKEHLKAAAKDAMFMLYRHGDGKLFDNPNVTLIQAGISSGDQLWIL